MPDMLVSLVNLPPVGDLLDALRAQGITLRRPHPWEAPALRDHILSLVGGDIPASWADEAAIAFHHQPVTCYCAWRDGQIIGFAAYECTRRNYFGPTGVAPAWRGKGIGQALLIAALTGLQDLGYTYAIIGGAGPTEFYSKTVGAIPIPIGDQLGIYKISEEPRLKGLR